MTLSGARGPIKVDEKKFRYIVTVENYNWDKKEWYTQITKRTNDRKAAEREVKRMTKREEEDYEYFKPKYPEYQKGRNITIVENW